MESFVDVWRYMPHGMCLLWQPWLVVLWAGSDALIFLAYMAIPLALLTVVRSRTDLRHRGLAFLFAGFILLCGLTHLLGVITLWWPIYPYVGIIKLATGLVSALTAIVLFRLVPALISIPSQSELEDVNNRLLETIAAHEAAEAELLEIKISLEEKVAGRTAELEQAKTRMSIVAREAVHRSKNLLTVVSSIARQSAREHRDISEYLPILLGRIDALSCATATLIGGETSGSADFRDVVENQIAPFRMTVGDRIRIEGPSLQVSTEAAQQVGLALHELATNAQKYGSLSEADGGVSITWRWEKCNETEHLLFEWSESYHSHSHDSAHSQGGFGQTLLTRIVPTMLQGTATCGVEQNRLVYKLNVPRSVLTPDGSASVDAAMAARIVDKNFGTA